MSGAEFFETFTLVGKGDFEVDFEVVVVQVVFEGDFLLVDGVCVVVSSGYLRVAVVMVDWMSSIEQTTLLPTCSSGVIMSTMLSLGTGKMFSVLASSDPDLVVTF